MPALLALLTLAAPIVARDLDYTLPAGGGLPAGSAEGYVAYRDQGRGKRPGVLIVHDWDGLTSYEQRRARQLAELGYVALAVDVYGKGVRPEGEARGKTAGGFYGDRAGYRARLKAGWDALIATGRVDPNRIGIMGYCFGGMGALEAGRAGWPLKAIVTFHGALNNPDPADARMIKAPVLVLHGAEDPYVSPKEVAAFESEMKAARRPYRIVAYRHAVHAFTVPEAGNNPKSGAAYEPAADKASFAEMRKFFAAKLKP